MFGIEGYEPQWHYSARTLAAAHRARFQALIGQRLHDVWLMWDLAADRWFAEGPVVLGFADANVEITHRKFDECAITWNQVDMLLPLHWSELRLDWRANAHPALPALRGRRLRAVNVIERLLSARWRPSVLHAVELLFDGPVPRRLGNPREAPGIPALGSGNALRLAVFNALDENGLTDAPEIYLPVGRWRRIIVA